ncbi:glycosyltransferase family 39 protein [Candidatus Marsarchaeota archaeon]|nr:glycosyltransferase family 39 protein [Candidatus Marsarchaeota archaeon]
MDLTSLSEYLFTAGILIAFVGTIFSAVMERRHIAKILKGSGIRRRHVIGAVIVALIFLTTEIAIVKPTQLLFFDDTIYQGGAVSLLSSGQAWMCNYGNPHTCYSGQIFHEPIGASFILAIGFAIFGVHLAVTYGVMLTVTFAAVLMIFLVGTLLLEDPVAGIFSGLILGLTPVVLVWAFPTTSDMPMMLFSLVAMFFLLVFIKRKSIYTFAAMLLSISLVTYFKVDALIYPPLFLVLFLILDRNGIRNNFKRFRRNILETGFLIVIFVFVLSILPEAIYTFTQYTSASYGLGQMVYVTQSCSASAGSFNPTHNLGLQNFEANFCTNALFWFNTYKNEYIMQPLLYTLLAIAGGVAMIVFRKKREFLALLVWFGTFFAIYTSFYAGSVQFGVDWRFMLATMPPVAIAGGYIASLPFLRGAKNRKKARLRSGFAKALRIALYAVIVFIIFYPLYAMEPLLSISPSQIPQAGNARFYEAFVYNNVSKVPASCLIFSYDPTLMIINNRTSDQLGNLYPQDYSTYKSQYNCLVVDWGYWCFTPNNYCSVIKSEFNLRSIVNSTYTPENQTYGFYYITGLKNGSA